jgi:hypothetical protein
VPRGDRGLVIGRIGADPFGVPGQIGTGPELSRRAGQNLVQGRLYPFWRRAQPGGQRLGVVITIEPGIAHQAGELGGQRPAVQLAE